MTKDEIITLQYGSGGNSYHRLVKEVFLPAFDNPILAELADASVADIASSHIAMTTDAFVVKPLFFPGGDIGRLAVCGTVNDLAMSGSKPRYLTVSMIIEAGFALDDLRKICSSMATAAQEADVLLVAGDTKVVDKGACDGIFITTAGVGEMLQQQKPSTVIEGDKIIVSGDIACHGMAIMAARHNLGFAPAIESDVAPLNSLAAAAFAVPDAVKTMRDPTRGGIASTLNEWAESFMVDIIIDEMALPLTNQVRAACDLLGIDPLHVANEGKLLALVDATKAEAVLQALCAHPLGKASAIIGEISKSGEANVFAKTQIGSKRIIHTIEGEQLPRIC